MRAMMLILLSMFPGEAALAACSSPAAEAGAREYFSAIKSYKLCDGTNWVDFKTAESLGACSGSGKLDWDGAQSAYKFCDGSNYIKVTPACTISSLAYKSKYANAAVLNFASRVLISPDGKRAFTTSQWTNIIGVLDISQAPLAPTLLGQSAANANYADSAYAAIYGNYLYIVGRTQKNLAIVDISSNTPVYKGRVQASPTDEMANIWGVAVQNDGKYAYTISWGSGSTANKCYFHSVDVSTPTAPFIAGKLNVTDALGGGRQYCNQIQLRGNVAYVSFADGNLTTIDVSDPFFPSILGNANNANAAQLQGFDLFSSTGTLYAAGATYANNKFNVFNVDVSTAVSWVTSLTNAIWDGSYGTRAVGKYALVAAETANNLSVVDMSSPASPSVVTSLTDATNLAGAEHIEVKGRYAFVTAYNAGAVTIVDLGCDPVITGTKGSCSTAGKVDYFPASRALAYCDGSDFQVMAQADVAPQPVDWADFKDASDLRAITDITTSVDLRFSYVNTSGTPTVQYRLNGGTWTTFTTGTPAQVTLNNLDGIEFKVSGSSGNSATITVTNLSDNSAVLDTTLGTVDYDYYYYVPNNTASTITAFKIGTDGSPTQISGSPFAAAAAFYSAYVDAQGKFLYFTAYGTDKVYGYAINQSTGAIGAQVTGSPFTVGDGPTQVFITPDNKFVYVGNYMDGTISAFTLNTSTGALTAVAGSPFAGAPAVADVQSDPASKFLYGVGDQNSSNLYGYSINTSTGALTVLAGFPKTPGRTPQTVIFDGTGKFLYTSNWGDNNIGAYSFNSSTGALTAVAGMPFATGTRPNSVVSDPLGKILFSGNSTANTITALSINTSTGALTTISGLSFAGSNPWDLQMDPSGKYFYSVNNGGNNITAFRASGNAQWASAITGSPFATGTGPQAGAFAKIARP